MSKRYAVSLPDVLADRLEALPKGKKPSLSEVLQQALCEELDRREGFQRRIQEEATMDSIIERLAQEKNALDNSYKDDGTREGLEFSKSATWKELEYVIKMKEGWTNYPLYRDLTDSGSLLEEYFETLFEEDASYQLDYDSHTGYLDSKSCEWLQAWLEVVENFYLEVAPKVTEAAAKLR